MKHIKAELFVTSSRVWEQSQSAETFSGTQAGSLDQQGTLLITSACSSVQCFRPGPPTAGACLSQMVSFNNHNDHNADVKASRRTSQSCRLQQLIPFVSLWFRNDITYLNTTEGFAVKRCQFSLKHHWDFVLWLCWNLGTCYNRCRKSRKFHLQFDEVCAPRGWRGQRALSDFMNTAMTFSNFKYFKTN